MVSYYLDYKYFFFTVFLFYSFYKSKYHYLLDKYLTKCFKNLFKENEKELVEIIESNNVVPVFKPVFKYEDKYIEDIKIMSKEFILTESQKELKAEMLVKFYNQLKNEHDLQINTIRDNMANNELLLTTYENKLINIKSGEAFESKNADKTENNNHDIEYEEEDYDEDELNELINDVLLDNQHLSQKLQSLALEITENKLMIHANELAYNYVYDEHFNKLINNFVIEKTPIGNVLMFYNNNKKAFQYYSDNTIPYKFLEVVARKYVKEFQCRCLYINMEDEMKRVDTKVVDTKVVENTKPLFAKFKTYNKSSSSYDKSAMVAPPKNNIVRNNATQVNKELVLKENANHFICSGKFFNFNFLKTVKRELVDKKRAITFNDFKNMKNTNAYF
jgi:hypothetical protein